MNYVPPPRVAPWCSCPDCPLSPPGLISATTHLFYPLLTSFIRSSAACDRLCRLCLVSCVPVHISKFPCLYHPLPPAGKCSFCHHVAATRGQQSLMEPGKTWLVAFLLLPGLLPAPTQHPLYGRLPGSCCRVVLLPALRHAALQRISGAEG